MNQAVSVATNSGYPDGQGEDCSFKSAGRWIGALMLAAFGLYGSGSILVEQVTSADVVTSEILASQSQLRIGALLIVANSVAVIAIGALMYRMAATTSEIVRLAYLGTRLFEGVLLAIGAVLVLLLIPAAEAGNGDIAVILTCGNTMAFQVAMFGLSVGSIPLFWSLANCRELPRWLSLWGVIGYAIFGAGAALEIYGVSAGVILSVPGGLFEVTFAIYLIWKGLPATSKGTTTANRGHAQLPAQDQ